MTFQVMRMNLSNHPSPEYLGQQRNCENFKSSASYYNQGIKEPRRMSQILHHHNTWVSKRLGSHNSCTCHWSLTALTNTSFFQKQAKGKSLLKQHENKLSWRQGLSHLLRRSKSSSSSTNNNVSVLRGKHSNSNSTTGNGTTGNSVSNKRPSGGDRESYLTGEADANKINPPSSSSPAHKCSELM